MDTVRSVEGLENLGSIVFVQERFQSLQIFIEKLKSV